jgi:hypothetical protein
MSKSIKSFYKRKEAASAAEEAEEQPAKAVKTTETELTEEQQKLVEAKKEAVRSNGFVLT